jgi:hypothetical protein
MDLDRFWGYSMINRIYAAQPSLVSTPNGFTGRTTMTRPASRARFTTNGISLRLCVWLHIREPADRGSLRARGCSCLRSSVDKAWRPAVNGEDMLSAKAAATATTIS